MIDDAFLAQASRPELEGLRRLLTGAGLRMHRRGNQLVFRADTVSLIRTKALQRMSDGGMRADAAETLREGDVLSASQAASTVELFRTKYASFLPEHSGGPARSIPPTSLDARQLELLWNLDELPVLQRMIDESGVRIRLFRVWATRALALREFFWRLVTAYAQDGMTLHSMMQGGSWPHIDQVSGTVSVHPAVWVTAPLSARQQPFAAGFMSPWGVEVVAVPLGVWNRNPYAELGWPVGFGGLRLAGSGVAAYERPGGDSKIPAGVAMELFSCLARGADRLLHQLTDPGSWVGSSSELEFTERQIAWSTLNLGFSTVKDMAQTWHDDSAGLWSAYRALDILAGHWSPPKSQTIEVRHLVHPDAITAHTRNTTSRWYNDWVADIAQNWRKVLSELHPSGSVDDRTRIIQELRNLVHGTGANPTKTRDRAARLRALNATGEANLQLVKDVATMWWLALLADPRKLGRVGPSL